MGWTLQLLSIAALPALLAALSVSPRRGSALGLVEENRKWNWKEASEETKTEWAIVLKRYVLADVTLFDLQRHFESALPVRGDEQGLEWHVDTDELDMARNKLHRLDDNLKKAILDQNTSDVTALDMQSNRRDNRLSPEEKKQLRDAHKQEQLGFFAVEASGQHVLQEATALLQALDAFVNESRSESKDWSEVAPTTSPAPSVGYLSMLPPVVNSSSTKLSITAANSNATSHRLQKTNALLYAMQGLYKEYELACQAFHSDLGSFEAKQAKVLTT
eukprot:CAMPEP_0178406316 /NCGR_PEP_ID=MMETSP0689_2-20121128/18849_1 /TAXON_ID=160604 /ORGANISM="Amphidinium massartii, Strain CS-259" /LENGTH=274 /DNA_ID=CAMNT_0020027353 /DNA_START=37 /DNA_END=861 /DNA_ORIENTATION=+